MTSEDTDKILESIKEACDERANKTENFEMLKEIYNHLSKYINEPSNQRPYSIKKIIDSKLCRGWKNEICWIDLKELQTILRIPR